jgi:hypothetical protein
VGGRITSDLALIMKGETRHTKIITRRRNIITRTEMILKRIMEEGIGSNQYFSIIR